MISGFTEVAEIRTKGVYGSEELLISDDNNKMLPFVKRHRFSFEGSHIIGQIGLYRRNITLSFSNLSLGCWRYGKK
jgi:hypothetical protein